MTPEQKEHCHKIIHEAAMAGAGVAAVGSQIPFADTPILIGLEIKMVKDLGQVFGFRVSEATAKGLLAGFVGAIAGHTISKTVFGWIPALGNAINAGTAAAVIEGLGWAAVKHFEKQQQKRGLISSSAPLAISGG